MKKKSIKIILEKKQERMIQKILLEYLLLESAKQFAEEFFQKFFNLIRNADGSFSASMKNEGAKLADFYKTLAADGSEKQLTNQQKTMLASFFTRAEIPATISLSLFRDLVSKQIFDTTADAVEPQQSQLIDSFITVLIKEDPVQRATMINQLYGLARKLAPPPAAPPPRFSPGSKIFRSGWKNDFASIQVLKAAISEIKITQELVYLVNNAIEIQKNLVFYFNRPMNPKSRAIFEDLAAKIDGGQIANNSEFNTEFLESFFKQFESTRGEGFWPIFKQELVGKTSEQQKEIVERILTQEERTVYINTINTMVKLANNYGIALQGYSNVFNAWFRNASAVMSVYADEGVKKLARWLLVAFWHLIVDLGITILNHAFLFKRQRFHIVNPIWRGTQKLFKVESPSQLSPPWFSWVAIMGGSWAYNWGFSAYLEGYYKAKPVADALKLDVDQLLRDDDIPDGVKKEISDSAEPIRELQARTEATFTIAKSAAFFYVTGGKGINWFWDNYIEKMVLEFTLKRPWLNREETIKKLKQENEKFKRRFLILSGLKLKAIRIQGKIVIITDKDKRSDLLLRITNIKDQIDDLVTKVDQDIKNVPSIEELRAINQQLKNINDELGINKEEEKEKEGNWRDEAS